VALREVFGSYYPDFTIQICYSRCCSSEWFMELVFFPAGEISAASFSGRLLCCALAFADVQHLKMSGIGTLCVRVQLSADYVVQT
jgi:hypothetical protein